MQGPGHYRAEVSKLASVTIRYNKVPVVDNTYVYKAWFFSNMTAGVFK